MAATSPDARTLLVELFVEELPPKALKALGEAFAQGLLDALRAEGLATTTSAVSPFASPRRLAASISGVLERAVDVAIVHKLMPAAVGLAPDGSPTQALLKKLAGLGEDAGAIGRLKRQGEGKAETLLLDAVKSGATLAEGLQRALDATLAKLPIPKVMQYPLADGWNVVHFVRPAHGLVALHGDTVVPVGVLGLQAGRRTRGHRFEARTDPIELRHAEAYAAALAEQGAVIASFAERRAEIVRQLAEAGAAEGLQPIDDTALLDEVTALVERPNVLRCRFDPEFLAVPPECLILTMKANQKYFPLLDAAGALSNRFLVVSNIRPADASKVIEGNERVVRPRLADARFFFEQDRKKTLASRVPALAQVVYHGQLGSQGERVGRVRSMAREIGQRLGGPELAARADLAAELAKADLLTDMVGEFPELQGVMGGYYARHDGLDETVAQAIEDHYRPRFSGDALPRGEVGVVVALADKLETLVGLFGIGQLPTGDRDPFALRRHALGVIRMLIERELPLAVPDLLDLAFAAFADVAEVRAERRGELSTFLDDRLVGYLRERGGHAAEVDAVVALRPPRWSELPERLAAVRAFAQLPEAPALASANKRVGNILRKSDVNLAAAPLTIQAGLLVEPAEQALQQALAAATPTVDAAFERGDLAGALQHLAMLKDPVDRFFEQVMVNAEDPALRGNRIALLHSLHRAMNRVADLSRLAA